MFEIKGKVNTAFCYAKVIEDEAIEQIRRMCDYEFTKDSRIAIMPDVHAGKGCTIGTRQINPVCRVAGAAYGEYTNNVPASIPAVPLHLDLPCRAALSCY